METDSSEQPQWNEMISELEEQELRDHDETQELVYKKLLILHLLEDQPMKAKFLWKRIPNDLKSTATQTTSELFNIWSITKLFIERKYPAVFSVVNELKMSSYQWSSDEIKNLLEQLIVVSKERLIDIVNFAYISIKVQDFASLFCVSEEEATKIGFAQKWTLDESKEFLIPKKKENKDIVDIPNQIQMQQLTNLVSFLEA